MDILAKTVLTLPFKEKLNYRTLPGTTWAEWTHGLFFVFMVDYLITTDLIDYRFYWVKLFPSLKVQND